MMDAEFPSERKACGIDVGDDDLASADALRDQRAHDADRASTCDKNILADQIKGQRRMHGIAERIEYRGDFIGTSSGIGTTLAAGTQNIRRRSRAG